MGDLAARLGHPPGARLLILSCDDGGVSQAANLAIHRALTGGVATSASLIVPAPCAQDAARMLRGLPLGVHLTLTAEYPALRWRGLTGGASLHDAAGFLHATTAAALAAVDAAEAREEGRAQIRAALGWGVDVTHLDAHMDVLHGREDLFDAYLDLAAAFRLPVRINDEAHAVPPGPVARARAAARGIACPDRLLYPWPRPVAAVLAEALPGLAPGVTEIFAHPVQDGAALRALSPRFAALRAADAEALVDPALAALLDAHGIRRIGYRPLRDLMRGGA